MLQVKSKLGFSYSCYIGKRLSESFFGNVIKVPSKVAYTYSLLVIDGRNYIILNHHQITIIQEENIYSLLFIMRTGPFHNLYQRSFYGVASNCFIRGQLIDFIIFPSMKSINSLMRYISKMNQNIYLIGFTLMSHFPHSLTNTHD